MRYTLAFDVYGTLINTSGVFISLQNRIGDQAQTFMDTWRDKQLEYSFRRGLMDKYTDFSVCTRDALNYSCKKFHIELSIDQKEALMEEYTILPAFPDVAEGLQNLKNDGHRLFAFSNGSKKALITLLTNANLIALFEGIISVESLKTFKPNPKVYAHFNKATHTDKAQSWLISSNPFDVIGAAAYGMNTAWLRRTADAVFDPWEYKPTIEINQLLELQKKLLTHP